MSVTATSVATPYKGLAPFEDSEVDALLFFGRERETEVIVANMLASKLTVLYGPSGVGKSSILRAAVARRLREIAPEAEVLVLDEWAVEPTLPQPDGEAFLILDQFEEYFLYHDAGPLHEALPALLAQPRVHVLLALREDALARLDVFQAQVPGVLANRLRLDQLDRSAARAAIVGPLDHWNAMASAGAAMAVEASLVDEALDEVESSPGRIEAPYLQLVMERVWEAEHEAGSQLMHAETLRELGGAGAIVSAHLERALGALPPRDAEIATSALKFLVTPSRTKIAQSFGDLVGYTNESPVALQQVLEILASQRILRAVAAGGGDDGSRYEIFHDVLAEPVLVWRRDYEARAALAAATRRHRRLAVIAGAAVLLAAAMVVLAVFAFAQQSEATKQKHAAEAQKELALGQKKLAQLQRLKAEAATRTAKEQTQAANDAKAAADESAHRAQASAEVAQEQEQQAKQSAQQAKESEQRAQTSKSQAQASEAKAKESEAKAKQSEAQAVNSKALAVHEQKVAEQQARRATRQALIAKVGRLVAVATADLTVDPVLSVKSALDASKLSSTPAVEDALRTSLDALQVRGILDGGGGAVNSAAFTRDGTLVATGAAGGDVRLFQVGTNRLVRTWKTGAAVEKVAFSPDGKQLAAASGKAALLYDVAGGKLQQRLQHSGAVLAAAYAGGGRYLVTGSADRSTRIWDAASGELLHTIAGSAAQQTIAVSTDGSLFAVLSQGQAAAGVYDSATGDNVATVHPPGPVTDLAFSPNGAYLVTTGRRNGFVWDTKAWSLLHTLSGHEAAIDDVAFAPDGRVVTASIDSSAFVWDPATGASLNELAGQHQQKVFAVAVSPDNSQVATASADDTARIWTDGLGAKARILAGHKDSVTGAQYSPDGSLLMTWSDDGTARIWKTGVPTLTTLGLQAAAVRTVAYSPDGRLVLSAGDDGTARLWRGGTVVQTLHQGGKVTSALFTAGGSEVLTAGDDGTAKLWRVADGALVATYPHGAPVRDAVVVPDAGIATAGGDGAVRFWRNGGAPAWSAANGSPVTAMAAGASGTIATGVKDGSVRLWRASDGRPLATLRGHTAEITSLAFSPDGSRLVSGSGDSTAVIWDVRTGRRLQTLAGHKFGVTSVSFSPDGMLVLTSSVDGDAWLWSVKTGQPVRKLKYHVATVSQAAFSPDGRWVVTAGPTATAIWLVRTGKLFLYAKGAHGNLSASGWAPDSLRIVTGDTGGGVETFTCALCGRLPSLVAQANQRIKGLG